MKSVKSSTLLKSNYTWLWRLYILFIFFTFVLTGFSLDDPTGDTEISCPAHITIQSGGNAEIEVAITIPEGNYIFIDHLSDNGIGILTTFHIKESTGFAIKDIIKPAGEKLENEIILYGTGAYTLTITDKEEHAPGSKLNLELEITTQLCNKKKGICFFPQTLKKEIIFKVSDSAWSDGEYEKYTYKTFADTPRANKRIDFVRLFT